MTQYKKQTNAQNLYRYDVIFQKYGPDAINLKLIFPKKLREHQSEC